MDPQKVENEAAGKRGDLFVSDPLHFQMIIPCGTKFLRRTDGRVGLLVHSPAGETYYKAPTEYVAYRCLVFLASWRLRERFFFKSVNDTQDAVLDQGSVEVD